jgi:hypothetical protein
MTTLRHTLVAATAALALGASLPITAALAQGQLPTAAASPAPARLEVPQSSRVEHDDIISYLNVVAQQQRRPSVAEAARKALEVMRPHFAREAEYVLPPLGLLPALAEGRATPEMRGAIAIADRVKAEQDRLYEEHVRITGVLNDLIAAAEGERERGLVAMARQAALHSLHEVEVLYPAVILIGDRLREKLGSSG